MMHRFLHSGCLSKGPQEYEVIDMRTRLVGPGDPGSWDRTGLRLVRRRLRPAPSLLTSLSVARKLTTRKIRPAGKAID